MSHTSAGPDSSISLEHLCDAANYPVLRSLAFDIALTPILSGIVHDLRNQLQSVTGTLPLLFDGGEDVPASVQKLATDGVEGSLAAVGAITSILELPRTDPPGPTPITDVFTLALELHGSGARGGAIPVRVEVGQEPPLPPLRCSAFDATCALIVLLNNAVDAIGDREDGEVRMDAVADGEEVVIEVIDNGEGFGDVRFDQAIEPLFTTRPHHLGLGLSLGYALVSQVGGTIALEPAGHGQGEGSRIVVRFPAWRGGA